MQGPRAKQRFCRASPGMWARGGWGHRGSLIRAGDLPLGVLICRVMGLVPPP